MENLLDANVLNLRGIGIVIGHEALGDGHAGFERSLLDAAYRHTTEEARIFESADLKKRCCIRVALRSRNLVDNEIHQDAKIAIRIVNFLAAAALAREKFMCVGDFKQLAPISQNQAARILQVDIFSYLRIVDEKGSCSIRIIFTKLSQDMFLIGGMTADVNRFQ